MNKTIGITGGSGFVGRHLTAELLKAGHTVMVFSRGGGQQRGKVTTVHWDPKRRELDTEALRGLDAVVNLAGAGVADKRWTKARKQEIISSRVDATQFLIDGLKAHAPRCQTFVSASATGYYGADKGGRAFVEDDPPSTDFLAEVCRKWEAAARQAEPFCRTVIFRFGIVLGKDGGAFPQLSGPMKFGVMPILGSGRQMVPWVHVDDIAGMICSALENDSFYDVYNAVAPNPVMHRTVMDAIAEAKGGIRVPVPVPAWALRIIMGEASEEVLKSCTASSARVEAAGYVFRYPGIREAVNNIVAP